MALPTASPTTRHNLVPLPLPFNHHPRPPRLPTQPQKTPRPPRPRPPTPPNQQTPLPLRSPDRPLDRLSLRRPHLHLVDAALYLLRLPRSLRRRHAGQQQTSGYSTHRPPLRRDDGDGNLAHKPTQRSVLFLQDRRGRHALLPRLHGLHAVRPDRHPRHALRLLAPSILCSTGDAEESVPGAQPHIPVPRNISRSAFESWVLES